MVSFFILGYLGTKNPTRVDLFWFENVYWAQICMILYFMFFFLMPIYTKLDPTKPPICEPFVFISVSIVRQFLILPQLSPQIPPILFDFAQ